jgi:hypothetical protein
MPCEQPGSPGATLRSVLLGVATVATLTSTPAAAQRTYKCVQDGAAHYSDRPCAIDAPVVLDAPRPPERVTPAHWPYLGPGCRALAEDIRRLAALSGTATDTWRERRVLDEQWDLHNCRADDAQARRRVLDASLGESARRQALARQAADVEALCTEMRRIRRQQEGRQAGMSAGERADLARFVRRTAERCPPAVEPLADPARNLTTNGPAMTPVQGPAAANRPRQPGSAPGSG